MGSLLYLSGGISFGDTGGSFAGDDDRRFVFSGVLFRVFFIFINIFSLSCFGWVYSFYRYRYWDDEGYYFIVFSCSFGS